MTDQSLPDDYEDFKSSVLGDAHADWVGVHEVWWEANFRYPALDASARLAIAERVVSDLRSACELDFSESAWPPVDFTPVLADRVDGLLRESNAWVPNREGVIWFTVRGET